MHVGQPLKLRQFQRDIIKGIYDTPTRQGIISFGRKNAKTALAACIVVLHLVGPEARANSHIYSAAQSRDQAGLVFGYASKIVRMSPSLANHVSVRDTAKELVVTELGIKYKALSADASTSYGLSPVLVIHDELGQVRGPRSELYEALETSMGAQAEPLSLVISTQAPNDSDLLSLLIDDALKGANPSKKLWLYAAPIDADPWELDTWKLANPALGDFLNLDEVKQQADTASRLPAQEASFRNLILNQRVEMNAPFISRSTWELNGTEPDMDVFTRHPVYVGLDLSARVDLTAAVFACRDDEGIVHVFPIVWTPEQGLHERAKRDRAPYDQWARQGKLFTTPGASVDYDFVADALMQRSADWDIVKIAFDRWRMDLVKASLARLGVGEDFMERFIPFGQGFKDMSPALDETEALLLNGKVRHGMHPVLQMCAANSTIIKDPAGGRKLNKAKSTGRIDAMVAMVMALGSLHQEQEKTVSVYSGRGLTFL